MSLCFSSGFENISSLVNCVATWRAMMDWTLDPNPSIYNLSPSGQESTIPDSSNVPIILRYSLLTLATLKPPNMTDLIHEAALEFRLDPNSIFLAIVINQCPVKISLSLYRRIAPLSTIHVQLNSPCHIFRPLARYSAPNSAIEPSTSTSLNTPATTTPATATPATTTPAITTTTTTFANQTYQSQFQNDQSFSELFSNFANIGPTGVDAPGQPTSVNDSSSTNDFSIGDPSPPESGNVSLQPSPIATIGAESSQLPQEKNSVAPQPSTSSTVKTPGGETAKAVTPIPAAATTPANGSTAQNGDSTSHKPPSKKRFLINSLASANTVNQQHRNSLGLEGDPHQSRRSKFPFLANRQASGGSPSINTVAIPIPDSPPPPSSNNDSDMFALDVFKNLSSSS